MEVVKHVPLLLFRVRKLPGLIRSVPLFAGGYWPQMNAFGLAIRGRAGNGELKIVLEVVWERGVGGY
jgi:hypothetical protein